MRSCQLTPGIGVLTVVVVRPEECFDFRNGPKPVERLTPVLPNVTRNHFGPKLLETRKLPTMLLLGQTGCAPYVDGTRRMLMG